MQSDFSCNPGPTIFYLSHSRPLFPLFSLFLIHLIANKIPNDWIQTAGLCFVDVEGTKDVKRLINLLAITVNLYHEIDADPSGSGSKTDRVRKQQMLIKYA